MVDKVYDLLVIGGGVNGVAIACDAAGRGLSVALVEQDDLASHTSSYSSKLIHGGLRYLEFYEFRLVREALKERQILLEKAPHIIHPLSIILPHDARQRPYWMVRLGLFLYDHLNLKQVLPKCKSLRFKEDNPLKSIFKKGFSYSDCTVDDSRLVALTAINAKQKGADIFTRHEVLAAARQNFRWETLVLDKATSTESTFTSKAIINAAGPWVDTIIDDKLQLHSTHEIRLVKGSHIVTTKLYEGDQAYILQNKDGRIIFAIPYQDDFTLVGTTDIEYEGAPGDVEISTEEEDYLLDVINTHFKKSATKNDIVWRFSGVRPLQKDEHADPKKVTRDYLLEVLDDNGKLPVLSIFGGKITTHRRLAEHAMEKLLPYFPDMSDPWTASSPLPGGDLGECDFDAFLNTVKSKYGWMDDDLAKRLAKSQGTRIFDMLDGVFSEDDMGRLFGGNLYEKEVKFLIEHEWAQTIDDILWRRTKQGLYFTDDEIQSLDKFIKDLK